jgi:hypothetical protein
VNPPVPTIVTFTPLQPPTHTAVAGRGRLFLHRCEDAFRHRHEQRLPLGSVRGIMYLDALCLHCGAHFVWVEDDTPATAPPSRPSPPPG